VLALIAICLASAPAAAADAGLRPAPARTFETIEWTTLLPEDWHGGYGLKTLSFALLGDDDPRARAALQHLKESLSRVPAVQALDKRRIRIAGYIVPLDRDGAHRLREFLLVPYFGACIHSPPPPPNQTLRVKLARPAEGLQSMDYAWVGGTMHIETTDTDQGRAGYLLDADVVTMISAARPEPDLVTRLKQVTPLLLVGVVPLLIASVLLVRWIERDRRRTPREVKLAARSATSQGKARRRGAKALERMTALQRLMHRLHLHRWPRTVKRSSR
jgi:hypothetical protein